MGHFGRGIHNASVVGLRAQVSSHTGVREFGNRHRHAQLPGWSPEPSRLPPSHYCSHADITFYVCHDVQKTRKPCCSLMV